MKTFTLSIVIITRNRTAELAACLQFLRRQSTPPLEIIVVDNGSEDTTILMLQTQYPEVILVPSATNLGVSGGRNLGYQSACGDICVTIDDDALLIDNHALANIANYFNTMPNLGCLSFEVRDAEGAVIRHYIPRRDRRQISTDTQGASFVGTGHAIHRELFLSLGGFWEDLHPYFGEEPDLSYRIIEAGYTILHTTRIAVTHVESAVERPADRRIYCGTRNTPWIALKSLPWYSVFSLTLLAWGYYFVQAVQYGVLKSYVRGIRDCIIGIPRVLKQRRCVSASTIATLRRYSGVYIY